MNEEIRWSEAELTEIVKTIPVATFKDMRLFSEYVKEHGYNNKEAAALYAVVSTSVPCFNDIEIKPDNKITFGEFYDFYNRACVQFIIIHRVNYLTHQAMIEVYDLLEKENKLWCRVKTNQIKAEKVWNAYEKPRRNIEHKEAWYTLQDYLRLVSDAVSPKLTKVYEAVRNYMIRLGWRDVEVKARIEVAMLLAKVGKHSFMAFFKEFENACGIDFSICFADSDLTLMVKHFSFMTMALGIKTANDKYGLPDIHGFDGDANLRVKWAWNDFIKALQDEEQMDKTANLALALNPTIAAGYEKAVKEDEQKQMNASIEELGKKFKVTKKQ